MIAWRHRGAGRTHRCLSTTVGECAARKRSGDIPHISAERDVYSLDNDSEVLMLGYPAWEHSLPRYLLRSGKRWKLVLFIFLLCLSSLFRVNSSVKFGYPQIHVHELTVGCATSRYSGCLAQEEKTQENNKNTKKIERCCHPSPNGGDDESAQHKYHE